jgi:hypothetical protein
MSEELSFIQGFGVVIASIVRQDEPTMAKNICEECGFTLKDFSKKEIDDYDLKEIKKLWRQK